MCVVLPPPFEERMRGLLGNDFPEFKEQLLSHGSVRGLRVNTRKISVERFREIFPYRIEKMRYNDDGFYLLEEAQMGGEVCHQAGMLYMQEPSAMTPVNSIDIQSHWKVLDLCAAPGGKTCQVADRLRGEGFVLANDVKFARCKALVENVERLGLENVVITSSGAQELCAGFSNYFDLVLVDATCSGEGMFRKNNALVPYWSEKSVSSKAEIQADLLRLAARCLAKGGILLYSTCTFSLEENERVVDSFLKEHRDFVLCDAKGEVKACTADGYPLHGELPFEKMRRFYPHLSPGEGQCFAILRKTAADGPCSYPQAMDKTKDAQRRTAERFLDELGVSAPIAPESIFVKGQKAWILPESKLLLGQNVAAHGVQLGTLSEGGMTPSHAFFMAYGPYFANQLRLDMRDYRLGQYLEGSPIPAPCPNGWGTVLVEGCAIGGYQAKNGVLKSQYPKNLTNKELFSA